MPDLIALSVQRLRAAGVQLDPGLTDEEVARIQERLEFVFGPEHRGLLQLALPVGDGWPDWRDGFPTVLRGWLDVPVEGVLFDVRHNDFWPASWGDLPHRQGPRKRRAREQLARVPRLVPLYRHRYLTADPQLVPSPVFSVHQTDVIYYGDNLLDYVAREFFMPPHHPSPDGTHVPFWSDLAEGAENPDL